MKIIGIVPPSRLRETENPYEDNAIFHELYTKRVEEAAGIPIGRGFSSLRCFLTLRRKKDFSLSFSGDCPCLENR